MKPKQPTVKFKKEPKVQQDTRKSARTQDDTESITHPKPLPIPIGQSNPPPALFPSRVLYTLPQPLPGTTGIVVCDPSTGVPLVGPTVGGPQWVLPTPPCIRIPTPVPPPDTSAPSSSGVSATQGPATTEPEHQMSMTVPPSVADIGLQTSFSDSTTDRGPHLTHEVRTTNTLVFIDKCYAGRDVYKCMSL